MQILERCTLDKVINPKTGRCVKMSNRDIQSALRRGYKIDDYYNLEPLIEKQKLKKSNNIISYNNDDNEFVSCGEKKIINPSTGRCILMNGTVGKRLLSVKRKTIHNKNNNFVIIKPDTIKPDTIKQKKSLLKDKPRTYLEDKAKYNKPIDLDTDNDGYVSIKEYLHEKESLGDNEKRKGQFYMFNSRSLGIEFLLTLILHHRGPIHKIACIPDYYLCIYKNTDGKLYTKESNNKICDRNGLIQGSIFERAAISIVNAPKAKEDTYNGTLLIPPNFVKVINKCMIDDKYMVVCNFNLFYSNDFMKTSHANALIFDLKHKTIERFDPHGGSSSFYEGYYALYNQDLIDKELKQQFGKLLPDFDYYDTNETCPRFGPQLKSDKFGGLCVTWSVMYMLLRLLNPKLSPDELTSKMTKGTQEEILNKILRFQKYVIKTLQEQTKGIL